MQQLLFGDISNFDVNICDSLSKYKSKINVLNFVSSDIWYENSHKPHCIMEKSLLGIIFSFDNSVLLNDDKIITTCASPVGKSTFWQFLGKSTN